MKLIHFFLVKKLSVQKARFFPNFLFVFICFLWARYGAGTGTVTCQKSEPEPDLFKSRNWNRKNSNGSTTLGLAHFRGINRRLLEGSLTFDSKLKATANQYIIPYGSKYVRPRFFRPQNQTFREYGSGKLTFEEHSVNAASRFFH